MLAHCEVPILGTSVLLMLYAKPAVTTFAWLVWRFSYIRTSQSMSHGLKHRMYLSQVYWYARVHLVFTNIDRNVTSYKWVSCLFLNGP